MELFKSELILSLDVKLDPPVEIGEISNGFLRIIPIIGGTFKGREMTGEILPGGADWNTEFSDGTAHVFAKYWIKTDDGIYISVENEGYLNLKSGGHTVSTAPRFSVSDQCRLKWLNNRLFTGGIKIPENEENKVNIMIYEIK